MKYRLIMGKNALREILEHAPERLVKIYTTHKNHDPLLQQMQKRNIPITHLSKDKLSQMVNSDSHQSFVAEIKETNQPTLETFFETCPENATVLMLDSIFDPHNMGAILRAAECFGVDLVIYSKNRGTDITPVVSKTSVGACELVPLRRVSNLAETVAQFQKRDFWVYAADVSEGALPTHQVSFAQKSLLIVGSEGKGIQPILLKKSDERIYIPMHGKIDSLNVSQATAVLLAAMKTR